jgi:hypothetical protein
VSLCAAHRVVSVLKDICDALALRGWLVGPLSADHDRRVLLRIFPLLALIEGSELLKVGLDITRRDDRRAKTRPFCLEVKVAQDDGDL